MAWKFGSDCHRLDFGKSFLLIPIAAWFQRVVLPLA